MPIRAIIIAVENYGSVDPGGLVSKLDGTLDDARDFRDWLLREKIQSAADIRFLQDPTKAQICGAFRDLVDVGKDATEEAYIFYSGHGFSYTDSPMRQKPADVLVGSEFKNLQDSGDACIALSKIQYALFQSLGPGIHYYFVDACRNEVSAGKVNPGGLGWSRDFSQLGPPDVFTLFSAARGNLAAVRSGFAPAVVDGLGGKGRAKRREGTEMWVSFDSLRMYLESRLPQKIDAEPGGGTGHILKIEPIPRYECKVEITNAEPTDTFTAIIQNAFHVPVGSPIAFQGNQTSLRQPPDDYFVQLTHTKFPVLPSQQAADLYDDCFLRFRKETALRASAPPEPPDSPLVNLSLNAPPNTILEVTNLITGEMFAPKLAFSEAVKPGPYRVRLLEGNKTTVRDFRVLVDANVTDKAIYEHMGQTYRYIARGGGLEINVGDRDPSELRDSILKLIPGAHDPARADFSESLGPMVNQDLSLWLSIIGASRILGNDQYSKLANLPLMSFEDVKRDDSPVYVLVGFEGAPEAVEGSVEIPDFEKTHRSLIPEIQYVPGLHELRRDVAPGPHIVNLKLGDTVPFATVIYTIKNRATLFTVAKGIRGGMRIHQFILPLAKLRQYLTQDEQWSQPQNLLEAIRFTTLAQKQVSRLRSLDEVAMRRNTDDPKILEDQHRWMELLYGKWLDPVMALMASYELARSVKKSDGIKAELDVALGNLRKYFGELPDVEIVARIAGQASKPVTSLPLFLAGLQALGTNVQFMPNYLPPNKLDYTGPWVTWLGVE
jgi:hypothetical protein